ncbi:MAG TPA: TetR/AcrR family transcriptional regulator [Candidatus Dormibacteraeota bacterium]|jgi:AcrR family transcriptional regulator
MPRTLDPAAHALRRDAFIEAAQRLMQTKGYEQVSIQDVLDAAETSRGAFYHYFDSKAALLEAVVERMTEAATTSLAPMLDDPELSAVAKLQGFFTGLTQWKEVRREMLLNLIGVWISDENAIVREHFRQNVAARLTPLLAGLVRQGNAEGTFDTGPALPTAGVLVSLILGANETASRLFVARQAGAISFEEVESTIAAFGAAFERILGLPAGSWPIFDPEILHRWFD